MNRQDEPFGPSDKTVIRLEPVSRPSSSAPSVERVPSQPVRPADPTRFEPASIPRGRSAMPASGTVLYQGEPFAALAAGDGARPLGQDAAHQPLAQKVLLQSTSLDYPSANPFIAASAPLLILLGQLRLRPVEIDVAPLADRLGDLIQAFSERISAPDAAEADARIATFLLCESTDDIVSNLPGMAEEAWRPHSMVNRFFRSEFTGTESFEALNKVMSQPDMHLDLIELFSACLSLGFEGQYRQLGREDRTFERVRNHVHQTLRSLRPQSGPNLSSHWMGVAAAVQQSRLRLPVWAVAAAACALVAGVFFGLRVLITDQGDALAGELLAANPSTPVVIARGDISPIPAQAETKPVVAIQTPPTAQLDRIRLALADDISRRNVSVGTKGEFIIIAIDNAMLFQPGQANTRPEFDPVATHIASILQAEPGPIKIVGHTDNVKPRKTSLYKSNYDLSLARATAVEKILVPKLSDASRIVAEGKGEDEPLADNSTVEGRAKNRRVDLLLRREENL